MALVRRHRHCAGVGAFDADVETFEIEDVGTGDVLYALARPDFIWSAVFLITDEFGLVDDDAGAFERDAFKVQIHGQEAKMPMEWESWNRPSTI